MNPHEATRAHYRNTLAARQRVFDANERATTAAEYQAAAKAVNDAIGAILVAAHYEREQRRATR